MDENDAKKLAESLHAIFHKTSAKSANGVEDLFAKIGKKFLDPKSGDAGGSSGINKNNPKNDKKDGIKLNKKSNEGKQKKGCC